jgi:choline dehydrogenase-like flavoprotein
MGFPDSTNAGWHHMGTTRMSNNPKTGVVDANCKVHGIANLYVAGSACYPTSGAPNPTLTLVALALRLSDHLKISPPPH